MSVKKKITFKIVDKSNVVSEYSFTFTESGNMWNLALTDNALQVLIEELSYKHSEIDY
jgi:hypothetical protein